MQIKTTIPESMPELEQELARFNRTHRAKRLCLLAYRGLMGSHSLTRDAGEPEGRHRSHQEPAEIQDASPEQDDDLLSVNRELIYDDD